MTDSTVAACRAALLRACRVMGVAHEPGPDGKMHQTEAVRVDDAAACMAEREAKLRAALQHVADEIRGQVTVGSLAHLTFDHRTYWHQLERVARDALGGTDATA